MVNNTFYCLIKNYLNELEKSMKSGHATEHTYRPALKKLLENFCDNIFVLNEPKRIKCGAPDYQILRNNKIVGHIEAKDIGYNLNNLLNNEQGKRYLASLNNIIFTNYLEFYLLINGGQIPIKTVTLGRKVKDKIIPTEEIDSFVKFIEIFLSHKGQVIKDTGLLSEKLALMAHEVREAINNSFSSESKSGQLHNQMKTFENVLLPHINVNQFSDMYAQTITYGLFAARINHDNNKEFTRENAAWSLPKTNPFLQNLFNEIAGPALDDRIIWIVEEIVKVLNNCDINSIIKSFKQKKEDDVVIHFYEKFLKKYDSRIRKLRGVYFTPEYIVSYIINSVDKVIKNNFSISEGLADPNVIILDPAVGTGTFINCIIKKIYNQFIDQQGMWTSYISEHLLSRVFGFEILMAPYSIAHLKIGLLLKELNFDLNKSERLGIYLTNTLQQTAKKTETLFSSWISQEANAATEIKNEKPIMVIVGNPPYNNFTGEENPYSDANKGKWITKLLMDYKKNLNELKTNLDDDYIKFMRFAQWRIEKTGHGVLAYITNNSYIDGINHRRMRESLLETFDEIYIINLHGESFIEYDGTDENVFDIYSVGVAISIFVKYKKRAEKPKVYYKSIYGTRNLKKDWLSKNDIKTTKWDKIFQPISPNYYFVPKNYGFKSEYDKGWSITDIFTHYSSGLETKRDSVTIHFNKKELNKALEKIRKTCKLNELRTILEKEYNLRKDSRDWKLKWAKEDIINNNGNIIFVYYRPFDIRLTYYTGKSRGFLGLPREKISKYIVNKNNKVLLFSRGDKTNNLNLFYVSKYLVDKHLLGTMHVNTYMAPLYLDDRPNLNEEFIKYVSDLLKLSYIKNGNGDLIENFGPEDIFDYIYALMYSQTYRDRYCEFLKEDFPKFLFTKDLALFRNLVHLGRELVNIHLLNSNHPSNTNIKFPIQRKSNKNMVEKITYISSGCKLSEDENYKGRIYINEQSCTGQEAQYFEGITEDVWNFKIGTYQVCKKWLNDRKNRSLGYNDLKIYQKIIVSIDKTINIMNKIDSILSCWPFT